jgi:hypothetical protein
MISLNSYHSQRLALVVFIISVFLAPMHFYHNIFVTGLFVIVMGCALWMLINTYFFAPSQYEQFTQGLVPLLQALLEERINNQALMKGLVESQSGYPEWVYRVGYNPALRAGFRFFLIQLEHVCELIFSINYYEQYRLNNEWLQRIAAPLKQVKQQNHQLLQTLLDHFQHRSVQPSAGNYIDDMDALSVTIKEVIPSNISLLDISPDSVALSAYLQDFIDLRRVLLQLITALPSSTPSV